MLPLLLLMGLGVAQVGPTTGAPPFPGPSTPFPGPSAPGAGLPGAPVPGGPTDPFAALFAPPPAAAPVVGPVHLARLVDPVAWLDGEARVERHLYFYDKFADLEAGDGVRQGVAGASELSFSDFSRVRQHGETQVWIQRITGNDHELRYEQVRHLIVEVVADSTLTLRLPGGYVLTASDLWCRISMDDLIRNYEIKNSGPGELRISGPTTAADTSVVLPGHEVSLRRVEDPQAVRFHKDSRPQDVFAGLAVRLDAEQTSERLEDGLWVRGTGTARVGGARIHLPSGEAIRIRRPAPVNVPPLEVE